MSNRRLAFIWIAVFLVLLFFGWLIVRAGEPVSDSLAVPKAKREKKISSYDPIKEKMKEQRLTLDSLIMKKKLKIDTNGISN